MTFDDIRYYLASSLFYSFKEVNDLLMVDVEGLFKQLGKTPPIAVMMASYLGINTKNKNTYNKDNMMKISQFDDLQLRQLMNRGKK